MNGSLPPNPIEEQTVTSATKLAAALASSVKTALVAHVALVMLPKLAVLVHDGDGLAAASKKARPPAHRLSHLAILAGGGGCIVAGLVAPGLCEWQRGVPDGIFEREGRKKIKADGRATPPRRNSMAVA